MEVPKQLDPYVCHGTHFVGESGDQLYGSCPFCGDDQHFYANKKNGLWDCKKCGRNGNASSFLEQLVEHWTDHTSDTDYRRLKALRGISTRTLRRYELTFNGEVWLIPHKNHRGGITDLRRWREGTRSMLSTKGCSTSLFGQQFFNKDKHKRIWVCEGEWDAMSLQSLFWALKASSELAVGVPGADTFKAAWVDLFIGRKAVLCYDNDDAGDRGSKKAQALLKGTATDLQYLCWPEIKPDGWDVRDQILAGKDVGHKFKRILKQLQGMLRARHRRDPDPIEESEKKGTAGYLVLPIQKRPTFERVVDTFRQHMKVDQEIEDGLLHVLSVIVSEQLPGPPVWTQIVGVPGVAKTMIILSTQASDRVVFRSTLNPKSLISGYRTTTGEDPSLFHEIQGKTLMIKDGTESHGGPKWVAQESDAILRGAHDGYVCRSYGNAVVREYLSHFSMVMGITNIIYALEQSALGERFLRFRFRPQEESERKDRIIAAARAMLKQVRAEEAVKPVVRDFLAFDVAGVPDVPPWFYERLAPLCELIAVMRATVERDFRDVVLYRPEPEYGTRLGQQLTKLAIAIAIVKRTAIDREIWNFVRRRAFDTATPYHWDVVRVLAKYGELKVDKLQKASRIPYTTLYRRLPDLEVLGVLQSKRVVRFGRGRAYEGVWRLHPSVKRWLQEVDYL